ncbi:hypothetical protein [Rubrimonas cliftonensis]|uniref:Uncharacterized protein n=1 Tax=Rubrimonas cliftonensis TaxID=89524 RepID=A0A1H4E559_9RHOB|nr:hypothetical protein [Rubrimonas cliftonensis]SEA79502.1 hypothetical protein SAMN05444370_11224 [Rubrimonas cliftonensis]
MSKHQKSNREAKKPKQEKPKAAPATPDLAARLTGGTGKPKAGAPKK